MGATHLIKVAVEAATGKRDHVSIYGDDYPTPDGTGVRDYIHVSDLADAHLHALEALIAEPGRNYTLNCGYGRGFSGARCWRPWIASPTSRSSGGSSRGAPATRLC